MKFATLALACSLLGTTAFAQDKTTAPAVTPQPQRNITVLAKGQPPMTLSLDSRLTEGAEFVFNAKTIISGENTTTFENNVTFMLKKQGKVLWSISVPEGSVIVSAKMAPPKQAPQ